MILSAESDIELQWLLVLSTNKESLSSEYHEQDMETLASSNYDAQIQFLYDVMHYLARKIFLEFLLALFYYQSDLLLL